MTSVLWLNGYIKECLNQKNVSIKMLCDEVGLNYNRILKAIKGETVFLPCDLKALLKSKYFTTDEMTKLKNAYEYTNLEGEGKRKIVDINNVLKGLYAAVTEEASLKENLLEAKGQESLISKLALNISDQLYKSYTKVLKKVFQEGTGKFEIVLYLPDFPALIHEIHHTLKALKACLDKRIRIKIDFLVEGNFYGGSTLNHKYSYYFKYINLITLSEDIALKFLKSSNTNLEYGLYFNDRTVLIDKNNLDITILHKNMMTDLETLDYMDSFVIETNFSKVKTLKDTVYLKKRNPFKHYRISNNLDPLFIGNKFMDACRDKINFVLDDVADNFDLKESVFFVSESGIELLLSEGMLADGLVMSSPIDDRLRLALVYDTLDKMNQGYKIRLLPKKSQTLYPHINIVQYFEIHKNEEELIFKNRKKSDAYFNDDNNPLNDKPHEIIINDTSVLAAFDLFCQKALHFVSVEEHETFESIKKIIRRQYANHPCDAIQSMMASIDALNFVAKK